MDTCRWSPNTGRLVLRHQLGKKRKEKHAGSGSEKLFVIVSISVDVYYRYSGYVLAIPGASSRPLRNRLDERWRPPFTHTIVLAHTPSTSNNLPPVKNYRQRQGRTCPPRINALKSKCLRDKHTVFRKVHQVGYISFRSVLVRGH